MNRSGSEVQVLRLARLIAAGFACLDRRTIVESARLAGEGRDVT